MRPDLSIQDHRHRRLSNAEKSGKFAATPPFIGVQSAGVEDLRLAKFCETMTGALSLRSGISAESLLTGSVFHIVPMCVREKMGRPYTDRIIAFMTDVVSGVIRSIRENKSNIRCLPPSAVNVNSAVLVRRYSSSSSGPRPARVGIIDYLNLTPESFFNGNLWHVVTTFLCRDGMNGSGNREFSGPFELYENFI